MWENIFEVNKYKTTFIWRLKYWVSQRFRMNLQRTFKVRPQSEVAESGRTLKNDFALPKVHDGDVHLLSNGYFKIALSHLH